MGLRIYELAKEFGVDSKRVIEVLKDKGENVKSHLSSVDADIGRRIIHGYIFGRNTDKGGIFIFQPFEDQSAISNITKDLKRSDFEISPMYLGVEYPTVSGISILSAPAFATSPNICFKNSLSVLVASSAENSTCKPCDFPYSTASIAFSKTCSRVILSLYSKWMSDVAMNVWI